MSQPPDRPSNPQSFPKKDVNNASKQTPADASPRSAKTQNPFVIAVAVLIALVVGASLYIAVRALTEKVRLFHGLQQIIDIVAATHDATADHHLDENNQGDLLANLERLGRVTSLGEIEGLKTLTNPWGGTVIALIVPGGHIRIETLVPPNICRRIVDDRNLKALGIEQIEAKDPKGSLRQIYTSRGNANGNLDVAAGCGNSTRSDMILTFPSH